MFAHQTKLQVVLVAERFKKASKADSFDDVVVLSTMHQPPVSSFLARLSLVLDGFVLILGTACVLGLSVDPVDLSFAVTPVVDCVAWRFLEIGVEVFAVVTALASWASLRRRLFR